MKKFKKLASRRVQMSGALGDVEKRLEDFGFNLYFSYLFDESLRVHAQLKDQYLEAFLDEDYEQMKKLDFEIATVESAFELTACMLDLTQDECS